ncbi:hypothetical protein BAZSYMB_GCONTIG00653_0 [Bathymodiolus azoricus thioautotrophic gill symbiont]|uniref:Uncharacterized protein n=1 Tax=Bathymodiolus azoricus thioautotrophic gill symbiont TaxID=235205 RepID=A0A1H6M095_9GAMM|nr:hypothetical protein BAZSYMB_GCONTIG00653_0 [Bathymodiolus azoricus thioautotrophic gill symbiont]
MYFTICPPQTMLVLPTKKTDLLFHTILQKDPILTR